MDGATLLLLLLASILPQALPLETGTCIAPLGMESGSIEDNQLSASSSFEHASVGPHNARVRVDKAGGAWCPRNMIGKDGGEWLQIDLGSMHVVTATETMGRFGNGQGAEFAESYLLEYWRPRLGRWVRYRNIQNSEVMEGNSNTYLAAKQELSPVIIASKIRFHPYSAHQRTICMRVEAYGCLYDGGVVSYSMPQGDKRGATYEFYDWNYDGQWRGDRLTSGLGSLTDGNLGPSDFKLSYYPKNRGWVGWKKDHRDFVEIIFEFETPQELHTVQLYCNNQFTKEVAIFEEVRAYFSIGGTVYHSDPVSFTPLPDEIFEDPRNISVSLHRRVGRFVKLELYFASKWILISEVSFDSSPARGNYTEEEVQSGEVREVEVAEDEAQSSQMPVIVGCLATVILLLAAVIFFIVSRSRARRKLIGGAALSAEKIALNCPEAQHSLGSSLGASSGHSSASRGLPLSGRSSDSPLPCLPLHPSTQPSPRLPRANGRASVPGSPAPRRPPPTPQHNNAQYNTGQQYNNSSQYNTGSQHNTPRNTSTGSTNTTNNNNGSNNSTNSGVNCTPHGTPRQRKRLISNPMADSHPLYMEPYQVMRYSPYVTYGHQGLVLGQHPPQALSDTSCGDYAVPMVPANYSDTDSDLERTEDYVFLQEPALATLPASLSTGRVPQIGEDAVQLNTLLSQGTFGSVHTGKVRCCQYLGRGEEETRLVAVKSMAGGAGEAERGEFVREVAVLACIEDPHIARVLGLGTSGPGPHFVVMEYLEHGDLTSFLASHLPEDTPFLLPATRTLSFPTLVYMAAQVASGMKYLESLNFVHRDLATRNCLVGRAYHIKICDFGTGNPAYRRDYVEVNGALVPLRWMAWESIVEGRYTTKSDVWAFGVTLWEILNFAGVRPHADLSETEVEERLRRRDLPALTAPRHCHRDLYDLILECCNAPEEQRPSFREIHLFLQRKNLGYSPI